MNMINLKPFYLLLLCITSNFAYSQNFLEKLNYFGVLPSVLSEPYDTINALDVNCVPFVFERRTINKLGIQIRPMINYRVYNKQNGVSHIGGTIMVNKYLTNLFKKENCRFIPSLGVYFTYTYNQLDRINTLILGVEPGILFKLSNTISINLGLQPGIDYFPDDYSRKYTGAKNGIKSHFGLIFHIGYNF